MFLMNQTRTRRGLSLVELLVVISILVLLAGFSIPLLKPRLEEQAVREASRTLNSFCSLAKARAVELRRPVGVWIVRSGDDGERCSRLFLAETPPPYAGDVLGATCALDGSGGLGSTGVATFSSTSASLPFLVQAGDRIRFSFSGPFFTITDVTTAAPIQVRFTHPSVPSPAATPLNAGVPYQIVRAPVKITSSDIDLPDATAIDLTLSGLGPEGRQFAPGTGPAEIVEPVVIMFRPDGSVEKIYQGTNSYAPAYSVHLMVGRSEQINLAAPAAVDGNLADGRGVWVSASHKNGAISTAGNAKFDEAATLPQMVRGARSLALQSRTAGE